MLRLYNYFIGVGKLRNSLGCVMIATSVQDAVFFVLRRRLQLTAIGFQAYWKPAYIPTAPGIEHPAVE